MHRASIICIYGYKGGLEGMVRCQTRCNRTAVNQRAVAVKSTSGFAAVETAGERIAAAPAEADPSGPRCESTESLNLATRNDTGPARNGGRRSAAPVNALAGLGGIDERVDVDIDV